uniref:DNA cytosine methyltransferase n=1 Tax=Thaumasiovibrio occultus TaxID=1891184 RepID=UPI000B35DD98|nr:DNA cytosine methyltransferase [Thaumasiovibrio occultus]
MESVELFAGGGGLAIGLERAGFRPHTIIEFNRNACKTLRQNYLASDHTAVFEGDIRQFDYQHLQTAPIRLVSGGPPCQPFSLGGNHRAHNDDRDMFPEAVRAVRELQPHAFIFENVKGLLRSSFAPYFDYILSQLRYPSITKQPEEDWESHAARLSAHQQLQPTPEYQLSYHLVNAADYGVPQKRERVFMVGFRRDIKPQWAFPAPTHSEDALLWSKWITGSYWQRHGVSAPVIDKKTAAKVAKLQKRYRDQPPTSLPWLTVRDALSDLPDPQSVASPANSVSNHDFKPGARIYPGHTGSYIDEPSKALKAGAHGVPGGENMIRYHDGSVRYFTVRESARLQTFPDSYVLEGAWGEAMRQLGNAVPVQLAKMVGESVFRSLAQWDEQWDESTKENSVMPASSAV